MLNFLPQKNKNKIIFEYLLRVTVFLLLFVFLSSFVLISLFVPSFFFAKYKNDTVNSQLELTKQKNINKDGDPTIFIKNVNRLVVALSNNNVSNMAYSDIINKVVSLKDKDIKISSINISEEANTNSKKILINGIAKTRDSLTLFDKEIRVDGFFESVIFPVSNFIKSTNSEFSATLIYKNK
ncbi:MAG: hypothetical protein WC933_01150 [Candidatus Paceibacterota bacterium]|jgi:hypothetical protein